MSERKYVPMPYANTDRVTTSATLPFAMHQEIGLDLSMIHRLLQIGGIKSLTINSDRNGKTSGSEVEIVGFSPNGGAYAGKTKTNTVPQSTQESHIIPLLKNKVFGQIQY